MPSGVTEGVSEMSEVEHRIRRLVEREPAMLADPWPLFDELRDEAGALVFSDAMGAWIATRRDVVLSILSDTATWSNRSPTSPGRPTALAERMAELAAEPEMAELMAELADERRQAAVLLLADPPAHVRQRLALNAAFRPKRIRALTPLVEEVSSRLVARFAARGRAELVAEYTTQLPMIMIGRMLGVPDADLPTFKRWSDDLTIPIGNADPSTDQVRSYLRSQRDFQDHFSELLHQRAADPRDDLISDVATASVDGVALTPAEQLSALTQFLVAGNETSTTMLSNIGRRLATDHELRDRLVADRDLVPALVEEALRFEAPVQGLFRQATTDTVVGDVTVAAGQFVWLAYAAANRDPSGCPVPHRFDVDRADNHHLAFGHGEHHCIGHGLARLEGVVGTNALLDLPSLTLADTHVDDYADSFILRGLRRLDVTFEPVDRR